MLKIFPVFLLALSLVLSGCATTTAPNPKDYNENSRNAAVSDFTKYLQEKMDATGMVAGAVFPDGKSFIASSGIADAEEPSIPLNEDTIFCLASLSKMHIYVLANALHSDGTIDLDDPIRKLVPELHEDYNSVTLRDLMCHRTGLPREYVNLDMWLDIPKCWLFAADLTRTYTTSEGLINTLNKKGCRDYLKHPSERYSNLGIGLLGIAMERASRKSIPELVDEYVSRPIGLTSTTFSMTAFPKNRYAGAHAGDIPKIAFRGDKIKIHLLGDGLRATGGVFSSAADEVKMMRYFMKLFATDDAVKKLSAADEGRMVYGFEFHISSDGERVLYRHGMTYGSETFVCFGLDSSLSIFVFYNNCDWPRYEELEFFSFCRALAAPTISE